MTKKAVVLLSGGIDSSTTLSIAKEEGFELYALTFDYMQRHRRELISATMVSKSVGVKKHLIIKFDMREIGASALTSDIDVPKISQEPIAKGHKSTKNTSVIEDLKNIINIPSYGIPITYVPARNTIFLSFALAWAESLEISDIFIGANAIDYSGYPDCRPEYLKAFEDMANLATKITVEGKLRFSIKSPLLYMTKGEIIKKGASLGLDYSLTWSCYDPQRTQGLKIKRLKSIINNKNSKTWLEFFPCGRCDSCIFRAKGFHEAQMQDPLLKIF